MGDVDPFFLRNNKNPLIATINTQKRMGLTSTLQEDSTWKFADKLMVFETEPFKSNIDIYYETSTTGIISELNNSILSDGSGTTDAPFGLSSVNINNWFENTTVNQSISNTFEVVNSSGASQAGTTALTTRVVIKEITNSGTGSATSGPTVVSESDWPIAIQQATAPVAPSTGPTFRFIAAKRHVFLNGSDTSRRYDVTLEISTDTYPSINVNIRAVQLSNITPIIYRISPDSSTSGTTRNGAEIVNQTNPLILQNSSQSSPIPTVFPGNVGSDYAMKLNATAQEKPGSGATAALILLAAGRFSFLTNGFDPITVFNATTDSGSIDSNTDRLDGIEYVIEKVTRYSGGYKEINSPNPNLSKSGEYYALGIGYPPSDKTQDFQTQNTTQNPSTLAVDYFIKYVGGRSFSGMPSNSEAGSGYKGAYIYEIILKTTDASGGTGSLTSSFYTIHYIIHR